MVSLEWAGVLLAEVDDGINTVLDTVEIIGDPAVLKVDDDYWQSNLQTDVSLCWLPAHASLTRSSQVLSCI